ncbi:5192_t:CDS:2, partial [Funneliformis mosseae]
IHKKIIEMDELFCTENLLNQLMLYIPTADERGKLSTYKDAPEDVLENLAYADRFFVEVMKIHRYEQRLKYMYFYVTFKEQFDDVDNSVLSILNASIALKESKHFKELLGLVDTKATHSSSHTLLHFLSNIVEDKLPHVLQFIDDLKDCGSACRVSQQEMTNEYRIMGTKLNDLSVELQKHFTDVELEKNDRFPIVMKSFVINSQQKFEELQVKYTAMEVAYKDVVAYFGEDPKNTKPDEFFGVFKTFITSFEKARNENKQQRERELAIQKRKEEAENRKKHARPSPSVNISSASQDSVEEKHLMDNLLESLRDGVDLDSRSRRRRGGKEKRLGRNMSIAMKAENILNRLKEDTPPIPDT